MSKTEKENRINSLAVTFLERQQIVPNLFADQIIRGYKEGYYQAEKDLKMMSFQTTPSQTGLEEAEKDNELTWEDLVLIRLAFDATEANINLGSLKISPMTKEYYQEVLRLFKDYKERKRK